MRKRGAGLTSPAISTKSSAQLAGLKHLVIHTGDESGLDFVDQALTEISILSNEHSAPPTVEQFIDRISERAFEWGDSDGN